MRARLTHWPDHAVAVATLTLFIACATGSYAQDLARIVCEGEDAPGRPGEVIRSVLPYSIGAGSHVVGRLSFGNSFTDMIFIGRDGALTDEVITEGDSVSGGTVTSFSNAMVSSSGKVLVEGNVDFGGDFAVNTVMAGSPGNLQALAYRGLAVNALGAGMNLSSVEAGPFMNASGTVAFSVSAADAGFNNFSTGVYRGSSYVLKPGTHYPGLPAGEGFLSVRLDGLNTDGSMIISGRVQPFEGGGNPTSIWLYSAGGIFSPIITGQNQAIAGVPFETNIGSPAIRSTASGGWIAVTGFLPGGSASDLGYLVASEAGITQIAREGDVAPGSGGRTIPQNFKRFDVMADGKAMLFVNLVNGSGIIDATGVFLWDGAGLNRVLVVGDDAPGFAGETITQINTARTTPDGRIVVAAQVSGGTGGAIFAGTNSLEVVGEPGLVIELDGGAQTTVTSVGPIASSNVHYSESTEQNATPNGKLAVFAITAGSQDCAAILDIDGGTGGDTGDISGQVREDLDGDGDFGDDDLGFAAITLRLFADDGNGEPTGGELESRAANPDGTYSFFDIAVGQYVVVGEFDANQAPDYLFTAPASGKLPVSVTIGETTSGSDLLCRAPSPNVHTAALQASLEAFIDLGIDEPLRPTEATGVLSNLGELTPGGGLVADGAMPLIIRIRVDNPPLSRTLRWDCVEIAGGSVAGGGILAHMRDYNLAAEQWLFASTTEPNVIATDDESEVFGHAFVSIDPLEPGDLIFSGATPEIDLELRVFDNGTGELLDTLPIKLRRPPVFLIPSSPSEGWGNDFINALKSSRMTDFIHDELTFDAEAVKAASDGSYFAITDVLADLDWEAEVDSHREQWALARPDVIAHGFGGNIALGLAIRESGANEKNFANAHNAYRGRYRRAVTIGTSHMNGSGVAAIWAVSLAEHLDLNGPTRFWVIPSTLSKIPAYSGNVAALRQRNSIRLNADSGFVGYDRAADLHLMASEVNSFTSEFFRLIGFGPGPQDALAADGIDGVIDVRDAVAAVLYSEGDQARTVLPGFLAHGEDRRLFADAPLQTHSAVTAASAIAVLDNGGDASFFSATSIGKIDSSLSARGISPAALEQLIEDQIAAPLTTLLELLEGRGPRDNDGSAKTFEIQEIAGHQVVGDPTFFAEAFVDGQVTTDGITLTPDAANPTRVAIEVDSALVGDVVLYAAYQTAGGTVLSEPILVCSEEASGVTAQSLTLEPDGITLGVGAALRPVVRVNYSDGTSIRRWLDRGNFTVSSSDSNIIDVSDQMSWECLGEGTATITLDYGTLSGQSTLTVTDPFPPVDFETWRAENFTVAELADPLISGTDADLDGDGLNTFFEYITGGNPRAADPGHVPQIKTVGDQTVFAVRVSSRIVGQEAVAQTSTDLSFWTDLPNEEPSLIADIDLGGHSEWWFDLGGIATGDFFFRLSVRQGAFVTGSTIYPFENNLSTVTYGDRVDGPLSDGRPFGGEPGYTPNIRNFHSPFGRRETGLGDLLEAAVTQTESRIEFLADLGYAVRLEGFDYAGYQADRPLDFIEVTDIDGNVLFSETNLIAPGTGHTHVDFSGLGLEADSLTLRMPGHSALVGFDNLHFSQIQKRDLGDWSMLLFEVSETFGVPVPQTYGDRIDGVGTAPVKYFGGGNFTPGIVASYEPDGRVRSIYAGWATFDFMAVNLDAATTPTVISLTADPGQQVRLFGFDLAHPENKVDQVTSLQVLDGSGNELFSMENFVISNVRKRFDFTAAPHDASEIVIRIDASGFGTDARRFGISNITFGQVAE